LHIKEAFLSLSADKVGKVIKAKNSSEEQRKPRINMTTRRPSWKQVIIPMAKLNIELIISSATQHIANINKYLKNIKSDVFANFIYVSNNGVTITMNKLANIFNLTTIKKYIKNIKNINSDSIESSQLSKSKSYLIIVRLPHKIEQDLITLEIIESILKELHILCWHQTTCHQSIS